MSVRLFVAAAVLAGSATTADAQYVQRYAATTNGGITFIGNTLGLNKRRSDDQPGTSGSIGTFTTIDTSRRDNLNWPFGTTEDWRLNSSSALLSMPPGSRVLHAELIWGGSYDRGFEDVSAFLDDPVNFTTPNGTFPVAPGVGTRSTRPATESNFYARTADVTALVRAGGSGSYTTARVPGTQGASEPNVNAAGWTLAVVYENFSVASRNLSLFVGFEPENGGSASVSGFCTPTSGPVSGRVAVSAIEGDTQIAGDTLRLGPNAFTLGLDRYRLSGPNNPIGNFFASQINGDDGNLLTTGTFGARNNRFTGTFDGGRQGWDITNVDASAQLIAGQTIAFARGTSTQDAYVITALALQIDVDAPKFGATSSTTVNRATAAVGDVLTYTVRVDNSGGMVDAANVVFTVPLPAGTSFVPGSFMVDGVASGANPVTGVPIGTIAAGSTRVVTFQLRVDGIPPAPAPARFEVAPTWTYGYVSCTGQPPQAQTFVSNTATTAIARIEAAKAATPVPVRPTEVLTYTIAVSNTGTAPSMGTRVSDPAPSGTTYVPNSTRLNGIPVADLLGTSPLVVGMEVHSPGRGSGRGAAGRGRAGRLPGRGQSVGHLRNHEHRERRTRRHGGSADGVSRVGDHSGDGQR